MLLESLGLILSGLALAPLAALLVPDEGEVELLDKMMKDALSVDESSTLKLYKTNVTPGESDTSGSYTEADFTSYTSKTLARASWAGASTSTGTTSTTYAAQSWTCGASGNTIYGYFVLGASSGKVLWAELFGTSRVLASGDTLNLTPAMQLA